MHSMRAHLFHVMDIQLSSINESFIYGVEEMIIQLHVIIYSVLIQVNLSFSLFQFHRIHSGTRQWSMISIVGDITPSPRDGHTACVINNRMYIFGGFEDQVK